MLWSAPRMKKKKKETYNSTRKARNKYWKVSNIPTLFAILCIVYIFRFNLADQTGITLMRIRRKVKEMNTALVRNAEMKLVQNPPVSTSSIKFFCQSKQ
mmetsp:Transcript_21916/g.32284  ORF Transcript_21916/g.32284 Transcript_21916/m.32284 type:complete len:99 (-) Transcript_21916:783-1079(-)|eukprot:14382303-Ditylum_brightwellii.AAC.1